MPGLPTFCGCCALPLVRPFVRRSWVQAPNALRRPTMASADFSLRRRLLPRQRRPFRRKAKSPQVRHMAFSAQPPDLHRLSLGRRSFAILGPLAPLDSASYPIPVRRLADSLAPSFSPPLAVGTLGFTWIATTYSPGDSHPQVTCHAGHTEKAPPAIRPCGANTQPMGLGRLELPTSRLSGLRSGSDPFRIKPVILRQTRILKGVGAGSLPVSNHLDPARYRSRQRNEQRKKRGSGGAAPQRRSKHLPTLGRRLTHSLSPYSYTGDRLMAEAPQQPHGKTSRDA